MNHLSLRPFWSDRERMASTPLFWQATGQFASSSDLSWVSRTRKVWEPITSCPVLGSLSGTFRRWRWWGFRRIPTRGLGSGSPEQPVHTGSGYSVTGLCCVPVEGVTSNATPRYLPERTETRDSHRDRYSRVHSSTIHSSRKTEATQVPINGRVDK